MTKKYSALKSILATASVAAITLGSTGALAAAAAGDTFRTYGNAALNNTANWKDYTVDNTLNTNATVAPGLNSTLQLGGAHNISLAGAGTTVAVIDLLAHSGQSITVDAANAYTVTNLQDTGGGNADYIDLSYTAAGTVAITTIGTTNGGANSVLRNVAFAGNNGTLQIGAGKVAGSITTTANYTGTLTIAGATTVAGTIGAAGNALNTININAAGTLTAGGAINATTTNVAAGSTLALGANLLTGAAVFTGDGYITTGPGGAAGAVTTTAAGQGTYSLSQGNLGGDVGAAANNLSIKVFNVANNGDSGTATHAVYAQTINVQGAHNFTVTGNEVVKATTINIAGGGTLTVGGNNVSATTTNVSGTLALGTFNITGNVGLVGPSTITATGAGHVIGNVTASVNNQGTYTLGGNNDNLVGNVGTNGSAIGTFNVGQTGAVTTNGYSVYANALNVAGNTFTVTAGDTLAVGAGNINLTGNLGLAVGAMASGTVTNGAGTLTFNGAPSATPNLSSAAGFTGAINIAAGGNVTQNLYTTNTITLGANTTLTGSNLTAGAIAGAFRLTVAGNSTITTTGAGITPNILIGNGNTLTLANGTNALGTIDSDNNANGTLVIAGATTVTGAIGGTKILADVTINAGAHLTTGADLTTAALVFGDNAATLTLAAGHILGVTGTTGAGNITTAGNATLLGNFGGLTNGAAGVNTLNAVTLAGNTTLTGSSITAVTIADAGGPHIVTVNGNSQITTTGGAGVNANLSTQISDAAILILGDRTVVYGTIDSATVNNLGNLTIAAPGGGAANGVTIAGVVGGTHSLANITVNQNAALITNAAVTATTTTLNGTLTANAAYNGNVNFGNNANQALTIGNGATLTGNVQFGNAADTITVANGCSLVGAVTGAGIGSYTLQGGYLGGNVGAAGAGNSISTFNAGATGNVNTNGNSVYAQNVVVQGNSFTVTAGDTLSATNITLNANAGFLASENVTATTINFTDGTSVLRNNDGKTLTVNNTTGAGTFMAKGSLVGNFGALGGGGANVLTLFRISSNTSPTLNGSVVAASITSNAGRSLTIVGNSSITTTGAGLDANSAIKIADGITLTLGDQTVVAGTIDSVNAGAGKLAIGAGANGVTLNAAVGGTNSLSTINVLAGATLTTAVAGAVTAANTTLNGTLNIGAGLAYNSVINAGNGTLNFLGDTSTSQTSTGGAFAGNININTTAVLGAGFNAALAATGLAALAAAAGHAFPGLPSGSVINTNLTTAAPGAITLHSHAIVVGNGALHGNIDLAAFNLFQAAGNVTGTVYSTGGAGEFISEVAAALPFLGLAGSSLNQAIIYNGAFTYGALANNSMFVNNFIVLQGTTFDTSAAGLNQVGDIVYEPNSTVNLGTQTQTATGDITLGGGGGAPDVTINTTANMAGGAGVIGKMNATGVITVAGNNITINVTDNGVTNGTPLTLLTNIDGAPTINGKHPVPPVVPALPIIAVLADGLNEFDVTLTGALGHQNLVLTARNNRVAAAAAGAGLAAGVATNPTTSDASANPNNAANIQKIINGAHWTGDAIGFRAEVENPFTANSKATQAQKDDAIETEVRVTNFNTNQAQDVNKHAVTTVLNVVSNRMQQVPSHGFKGFKGVSGGSEDSPYIGGVWVKGVASNATQKVNKGVAGYKSATLAMVLGADGFVNEEMRVGIAGSYSDGRVKMTNYKSGDRVNSKSWILSLYGSYDITDSLFANANATFATTSVTSIEKKLSNSVRSESKGDYNSQAYVLDASTGYRINLSENVMFTPDVGFTLLGFNNGSYTEEGGAYRRTITNKGGVEFIGNVGANLSASFDHAHGVIAPSVYARLSQYLAGKNPSSSARLDGQTEAFSNKQKPTNKTMFHVGVDAMASYEMMEYGASYDFAVGNNKYTANTGSLKLKVNF